MHHCETRVPNRSEPAEQLSINNQRRLSLTKVVKLRSEVLNRKKQKFREFVTLGKK